MHPLTQNNPWPRPGSGYQDKGKLGEQMRVLTQTGASNPRVYSCLPNSEREKKTGPKKKSGREIFHVKASLWLNDWNRRNEGEKEEDPMSGR